MVSTVVDYQSIALVEGWICSTTHTMDQPDTNNTTTDAHPVFAAVYDFTRRWRESGFMVEPRRYLSADLSGTVLDVGAGTGDMFPYFKTAIERGTSLELHGVEPDPSMLRRAESRADETGIPIDLRPERAESLPYDDERFDRVVACVVFCTIPDVERALREIYRVLKPGGELRFHEHVRSDGVSGHVQDAITPVWKRLNAGCHLNRRTETVIRNSPLELVELEHMESRFQPMKRGTAIRRRP